MVPSLVLVTLLGASAGCSGVMRMGMGPCVDTEGHPGFDLTLTLGIGSKGTMVTGRVGGGMSGEPTAGSFVGGVGLEGAGLVDREPIVLHGNVGYAGRTLDRLPKESLHGFSLGFGGAWAFDIRHSRLFGRQTFLDALGLMPHAEVLWSEGRPIGYFSFPITLQRMSL